jgi:signal recognition particle receptor subunit beta
LVSTQAVSCFDGWPPRSRENHHSVQTKAACIWLLVSAAATTDLSPGDFYGSSSIYLDQTQQLGGECHIDVIPTIGFNVEDITIHHQNHDVRLTVWDLRGQCQQPFRAVWNHYLPGSDALIYVVDASDSIDRLAEAGLGLQELLTSDPESFRNLPVLVFWNKQDLLISNGASIKEVGEYLGLGSRRQPHSFPWHIQPCSAILGQGLFEGLDWLAQQIVLPVDERQRRARNIVKEP